MNQLTIRVVPDDDGVWQIHFDLHTETFSGRGWFWGAPASLTGFASDLTAYPLVNDPALVLGYDQMQGDDVMLHLSIRPFGPWVFLKLGSRSPTETIPPVGSRVNF